MRKLRLAKQAPQSTDGVVFDLGVSEGDDTAYYLAKGFKVVAVEADPSMVVRLRERFAAEIASRTLMLLPFAASDTFGDVVDFHIHKNVQAVSGVRFNPDLRVDDYLEACRVMTIDWATLLAQAWPRYVKIDIENNEVPFLSGMARTGIVPEFISVEAHSLEPVEILFELGYRRFKLVDQNPIGGFEMPAPQKEGLHVENFDFRQASGPFGLDVFHDGKWLDFDAFKKSWAEVQPSRARGTWFDCHAWKPIETLSRRIIRRLLTR